MFERSLTSRHRLANRAALAAAGMGLGLVAALPAFALTPFRVGTEFQINTQTTAVHGRPSVGAAADGSFVVAWTSDKSFGTDTSDTSIQGQRFAADGSMQGAQFQINSYTTLSQGYVSLAVAPDGDFVAAWQSFRSAGSDTSFASIQAQRFASDGSMQGAQFQVNSYTTDYQREPSVAISPNGDFVVVWASRGSPGTDSSIDSIQGQRFAANGTPLGAQFQVNTFTTSYQRYGKVAVQPDGDFVVVWASYGSFGNDQSAESVQGQRYASDGSPQGTQFQINTYTTWDQTTPSIATADDGSFVVVWTAGIHGITAQRFDSGGSALGTEFQLNTPPPTGGYAPAVALAPGGTHLAAWTSEGSHSTDTFQQSIQGQGFDSEGALQGTQFQVNTFTGYGQTYPSVAAISDHEFVVVWGSGASPNSVFDSIRGQRYGTLREVPALSPTMGFALGAALLIAGACRAGRARDPRVRARE